ncbi:MAG: serine protease [Actinomycetota bacterium]|nr:serine protease [Actinomycetota bacterium]
MSRSKQDRPKPTRRRRLLAPLVVTILVLVAAGLGSFFWTAHAMHTAVSDSRTGPSAPTTAAGSTAKSAAAASQSALLAQVHGAVWAVNTLDAEGNPSVGSAFAVVSGPSQTLLVTSYSVVAAATYRAAPPLQVNQGGGPDQPVTLRTWDPGHDLALLVMAVGNQPVLHGTGGIPAAAGQAVDMVSGAGGANGAIAAGKLLAVSATALADDIPPGNDGRGGPVIDTSGDVVGVASSAFMPPPSAATPTGAHVGVPIGVVCAEVLVCPGGSFP